MVRLISAETNRRDNASGKKYTAYVLQVKFANDQVIQIEHRYSQFAKLRDSFKKHCVHLDAEFPPKHQLLGTLLTWMPSDRHEEELVRYRKVQLGLWLSHVTTKYKLGDLPRSLKRLVRDFLTLSDRPPRDLQNTMTSSTSPSLPSGFIPRGTNVPPF